MDSILNLGLTNALTAAALALVAAATARFTRRPGLWYALWLAVLLRLLAPPIFAADLAIPDFASGAVDHDAVAAVSVSGGAVALDEAGFSADPLTLLAVAWFIGAQMVLGLSLFQSIRLRRVLASGSPTSSHITHRAKGIAKDLGLRRAPPVVEVDGRVPPMLWAFFGSVRMILPTELLDRLDPNETDTLLAHELAHLSRRDHWVRHLELAAVTLFWWHPVAWWATRRLRRAQELCCDRRVAELLPQHRRAYADCLVETSRFLSGRRLPLGWPARAMADLSQMKGRIRMIMTTATDRKMSLSTKILVTVVLVAALAVTPVLTATPEEPEFTGEPISLSLKDADLHDVLATFSEITGIEILVEPGVSGTVTTFVEREPWDGALAMILEGLHLTWEREDGRIIVRQTQGERMSLMIPPATTGTIAQSKTTGDDVFDFVMYGSMQPPELQERLQPHYPPEMRKAGISGPVVASLLIDKSGIVREVEIVKSPADELSAAATEAVQQWVFEPATKDGEPVAVRFMVTVMFRLK